MLIRYDNFYDDIVFEGNQMDNPTEKQKPRPRKAVTSTVEEVKPPVKVEQLTDEDFFTSKLDHLNYNYLPEGYGTEFLRRIREKYAATGVGVPLKVVRHCPTGINGWMDGWSAGLDFYIGKLTFGLASMPSGTRRSISLSGLVGNPHGAYGYCFPPESLRFASKEDEEEAKKQEEIRLKTIIPWWTGVGIQMKDGAGSIVASFSSSSTTHCCAVYQMGKFVDPNNEILYPKLVDGVKLFLKSWGRKGGMIFGDFVKKLGNDKYEGDLWLKAFLEAGFKQMGEEYENFVHPGNMITSIYYQINPQKKEITQ